MFYGTDGTLECSKKEKRIQSDTLKYSQIQLRYSQIRSDTVGYSQIQSGAV